MIIQIWTQYEQENIEEVKIKYFGRIFARMDDFYNNKSIYIIIVILVCSTSHPKT